MKNKNIKNIDQVYKLLGPKTVLIPIKTGEKTPSIKSYKNLKFEQTQDEKFQEKLKSSTNVAVLQGEKSSGLCSIDIDSDELCGDFLINNPQMKNTLITKGQRGANFWFYTLGHPPGLKGFEWGEIRGNGAYTIIFGIHPCGDNYSTINLAKPICLELDEINLPSEGVNFSPPYFAKSKSITETETKTISYNYITCDMTSVESKIDALNEANKRYDEWQNNTSPHIVKNYETYIEREDDMDFSIRNHELIRQTTLLYKRVGTEMTEILIRAFYEVNQPFFKADIHNHMKEFSAHLKALESDFLCCLTNEEFKDYQRLNLAHQDAYRICRDLASFHDEEYEPPNFHLSYQQLANRINTHPQAAQRIMKDLKTLGFVSVVKKGLRYKKGRRSRASVWEWKLSLDL